MHSSQEFIAAANATKQGLWIRELLGELLGSVSPVHLGVDNQAALTRITQHTAGKCGRSKHIDVQFQFVRESFQSAEVLVQFVPTTEQRADMFTKQSGGPEFAKHRKLIDMCERTSDEANEGRYIPCGPSRWTH